MKLSSITQPDTQIYTMDEQKHVRAVLDKINLCGCGSVDRWGIIFQMMKRGESHGPGKESMGSFYDPMRDGNFDLSADAVEFIAHTMEGWGLLEHGTSVGHAWLTEDGEFFLAFLQTFGDYDRWPQWATSVPAGVEW